VSIQIITSYYTNYFYSDININCECRISDLNESPLLVALRRSDIFRNSTS